MNTKHTPRTDAVMTGIIGFYSCATVPASLSADLETELQSITAQRDAMLEACKSVCAAMDDCLPIIDGHRVDGYYYRAKLYSLDCAADAARAAIAAYNLMDEK